MKNTIHHFQRSILLLGCFFISVMSQAQPKLVGMMYSGGADASGTIIQYTAGDTVISAVDNLTTSSNPDATFTEGPNGKLYGIANYGDSTPNGAILSYDIASNSYTVRAKLSSYIGGYQGSGPLYLAPDGLLYGLSYNGGYNSGGVLFSFDINTDSVTQLAVLPIRAYPRGSVIEASDGNLYGLTEQDGGVNRDGGTIFCYKIKQHGYYSDYTLLEFSSPPGSLIQIGNDTLYGVVSYTIPKLDRFAKSTNKV